MSGGAGVPPTPFEREPFLLAMDTSSRVGSVAVGRGREVLARGFLTEQRRQAALLLPAVARVLEEAGVERRELGGILVGRGPGSFTGVRVAAATARGLAMALDIPLWPLSSLAAGAASEGAHIPPELLALLRREDGQSGDPREEAPAGDVPRYVLFDARGERLYAAGYRLSFAGFEEVHPPTALTLEELLARGWEAGTRFAGDGARVHARRLREAGGVILPPPAGLPTAEGLLRLHRERPDEAPVDPRSRWEPEYLRASSAEREAVGGGGGS